MQRLFQGSQLNVQLLKTVPKCPTGSGRRPVSNVRALSDATESKVAPASTPVPGTDYKYIGPEPKRFTVPDGQMGEDDGKYAVTKVSGRKLSESSAEVSTFRRPVLPLELYEFEACPYCKKVREAISVLDLDVLVRPCPKDGPTYRLKVVQMGGKSQFPYLIDPNTSKSMYESDEIIAYLFEQYGPGKDAIPWLLRPGAFTNLTAGLSSVTRSMRGRTYRKAKVPEQPLVLWGYEPSPFVKVVRETLCELELPYNFYTAARGSPKRQMLFEKRGHFQVPYLEDPNQKVALFESSAIVKYLEDTYAIKP